MACEDGVNGGSGGGGGGDGGCGSKFEYTVKKFLR